MSKIHDSVDEYYSNYEQGFALAWAQAHLTEFMRQHPDCTLAEKEKEFLDAIEGGFNLALKHRQRY